MARVPIIPQNSGRLASSGARANPNAFGAPLAEGISDLAAAADRAQREVEAQNQQTLRFDTQRRFTEFLGEQGRAFEEAQRSMPVNGVGFSEGIDVAYGEASRAFLETLPADDLLVAEYSARVEAGRQSILDRANAAQWDRQQGFFRESLQSELLAQRNAIVQGGVELGDSLNQVAALIEQSSLPPAEKAAIAKEVERSLVGAEYFRELRNARLFQRGELGVPDGSTAVASDLPGAARAFLDFTAKGESGGSYTVMYTPAGSPRRTFSDFSQHPNQAVTITEGPEAGNVSTAAGRYQFTYPTWKEAQAALNLPDFSPESQDRAAWWLAQRDYRLNTGGRDLLTDIAEGTFDITALETTWAAFKGEDPVAAAFALQQGIGAAAPSVPDVMNDPKYASLSIEERMQLQDSADAEAARAGRERDREQREAYELRYDDLLMTIQRDVGAGAAAFEEWETGSRWLNSEDRGRALGAIQSAMKEGRNEARATSKLTNPGYIWAETEDDRKDLNRLYESLDAGIQAQDPEAALQLDRLVSQPNVNMLPSNAVKRLSAMTQVNDWQTVTYAYDTLAQLESSAPQAFQRAVTDDLYSDILFWRKKDFYDSEEFQNRILNRNRQEDYQAREVFRVEARAHLQDLNPSDIMNEFVSFFEFNPDFPRSERLMDSFVSDYRAIYEDEYTRYREPEATHEATIARLQRNWGKSDVASSRTLLKYPPEVMGYPELEGSYEWVEAIP